MPETKLAKLISRKVVWQLKTHISIGFYYLCFKMLFKNAMHLDDTGEMLLVKCLALLIFSLCPYSYKEQ